MNEVLETNFVESVFRKLRFPSGNDWEEILQQDLSELKDEELFKLSTDAWWDHMQTPFSEDRPFDAWLKLRKERERRCDEGCAIHLTR